MSSSRAFVLLSLLVVAPAFAETGTVRRLALLVGVNDGGAERVRLRYAVSDARSFDKVLGELGGVAPEDRRLLLEAGRERLVEALAELRARTQAARASGASRVEVLVYYSGHSDEEGLLLEGERMDYGELRRALEALPADVRIAVLDSCASGAFARTRGGTRRPAFLVDSGSEVKGHAILTSSSEDEDSQESDRLGGSYFTHHLISGLRGAADTNHDGRVTLSEAHQFAFHETLARTEKTRGGAQHPAHDIELAGSGDLVMTDLRATSEKKGQFHVEAWASDIQLTNLAVKFGGKYVYTTLLAGIGPDDRLQRFSLGLGLGVHLPLGQRLWLDGDVAGSSVRPVRDPFGYNANLLAQGRLMLGVDILERLAVFGGVTYNTYFAWSDADRRTLSTLPVRQRQLDETTTVQYWPGVQLGVRI